MAFKQTEVPYNGHLLTLEKMKADPSKIEAAPAMERPTDVSGVRRLISTVNYPASCAEAVRSFRASQATHKEGDGVSMG